MTERNNEDAALIDAAKSVIDKDAIIRQQEIIIRDLTTTINALRTELAPHRQWDSFARKQPWQFMLFLLLKDVWPFRLWYGRFDGGVQ